MAKLNVQDLQNYYQNIGRGNPYALSTDATYYKNMYDQATAAAQAVEERSIENAESAWQRNLANTQATALDTIRKNNASAIATGASKGMQAANELSAVLGLQDTAVEESTALAQQRLDLADTYAAEYAKNAVTAQQTVDANKQAMMQYASDLYGYDTQIDAQKNTSEAYTLIKYAQELAASGDPNKITLANTIYNGLEMPYKLSTTDGTTAVSSVPSRVEETAIVANPDASYKTHTTSTPVIAKGEKVHFQDGSGNQVDYKVHEKASDSVDAVLREQGMVPGQIWQYNGNYYLMGSSGKVIRRITKID